MTTNSGADMNLMTNTLERKPAETASITDIAETTASACLGNARAPACRASSRASTTTPCARSASRRASTRCSRSLPRATAITAVEIGHELDIEKSTLSRNLKRLLALGHINMDPPAGRRGRGLHLTPKGQAILKDAFPIWQDAQKRAFTVMGAESRNTLDSLLHQAEKLVPSEPRPV